MIRRTDIERFWTLIRRDPTGCWLWAGAVDRSGYGKFRVDHRQPVAHRWLYEQLVGPVPAGLQLDHLCRVRVCVNPAHLEPVTAQENTRRARRDAQPRPRRVVPKTHCKHGHEFTPENTRIRPDRTRLCITCDRRQSAAKRAKRRGFETARGSGVGPGAHKKEGTR